jgi:hypothetical protein
LPVSRIKAIEILLKHFKKDSGSIDSKVKIRFTDIKPRVRGYAFVQRACSLGVVECEESHFYPYEPLSLNDFADWFFRLEYGGQSHELVVRYPTAKKEATRHWMEARRLNLISGNSLTQKTLQDFLYRHSVSEANYGLPYADYLVASKKEISADRYHNLKEIETMQAGLQGLLAQYERQKSLSSNEHRLVEKLKGDLGALEDVRLQLASAPAF